MTPSNVEDYGVKVTFDNSDFNGNIDSSEKKLNSFKDTLSSFSNSLRNIRFNGNINLGELLNFAAIQTGIYRIKNEIESIGDPIESVAEKSLRVVTNVVNSAVQQIKSGGMQRALNIEAAKFQIEGLKLDVDTFMEAADYAVSGTAYSLDAAAKAASQLGASGITQLEDLKKALRGISGVAAMANSDYESIAHIFTTVAGQGKLMTMQLQSLSTRGLNVAAELGKVLGKTEKEIRDMISKGQIDFKTFAMAMDDAFGEHAKDANKTFTGAMSNIRASLSRIGEAFATPYIQDMVSVFNETRLALNAFKTELGENEVFVNAAESIDLITDKLATMIKWVRDAINETTMIEEIGVAFDEVSDTINQLATAFSFAYGGEIKQIVENVSALVNVARRLFSIITDAYNEVIGITNTGSAFINMLIYISELCMDIVHIFNDYETDISNTLKSWLTAIKSIIVAIKDILGINKENISKMFDGAVKGVFEFVKGLKLTDETIDKITRSFKGVASIVSLVASLVVQIFNFVKPAINAIFTLVKGLADSILDVTAYLGDFFTELNKSQKEQKMFETFFDTLTKYFGFLFDFLKKIGKAFGDIFIKQDSETSGLSFIEKIFAFIDRVGELASEAMDKFSFNGIDFTPIQEFLKNISNFGFSDSEMNTAADGLEKSGNFIVKVLDWIKQIFGDLFSSKDKNSVVQSGTVEKTSKFTDVIVNILTWIQDLITTIVENTDPALLATGVLGGLAGLITASALLIDALLQGIAKIMEVILGFIIERDVKKFGEQHDIFSQMSKLTDSFTKLTDKLPDMVKSVKDAVAGFKPLEGVFGGKKSVAEEISGLLMAFVALIAAIAGALFFVALIPESDLNKAVGALAIMVGLITAVTITFTILSKSMGPLDNLLKSPLTGIASAFAIIGFALVELATAIYVTAKALNGLKVETVIGVVASIGALLVVVSGILIAFSLFQEKVAVLPSDFMFLAGAFALFGLAIVQIGLAIAAIAVAIDGTDITKAWAAVGMISVIIGIASAVFALMAFFIKDNPMAGLNMLLAGAGLALMLAGISGIILSITAMLLMISTIDVDKLDKATDAMQGIIIALGVVMVILSVIGLVAGLSGELGSLGLIALAIAIQTFANLISSLAKPLAAAGVVLASFALILKSVQEIFEYMRGLDAKDAKQIGDNIKQIIVSVAEAIPEAIGRQTIKGLETLKKLFPEYLNFMNGSLVPFIGQILLGMSQPLSEKALEALINIMSTLRTYLPDIFKTLYDLFFGPGQIYDTIIQWSDELWDRTVEWLKNRIPTWVLDIADILLLLIRSINSAMEGKWEEFDKEIDELIQNTIEFIDGIISDAKTQADIDSLFNSIANIISQAVSDNSYIVHDAFRDLAGEAIAGFIEGITNSDDTGLFDKLDLFGNISDWRFGGSGLTLSAVGQANNMPNSQYAQQAILDYQNQYMQTGQKMDQKQQKTIININNESNAYGIVKSIVNYGREQSRSGSNMITVSQ